MAKSNKSLVARTNNSKRDSSKRTEKNHRTPVNNNSDNDDDDDDSTDGKQKADDVDNSRRSEKGDSDDEVPDEENVDPEPARKEKQIGNSTHDVSKLLDDIRRLEHHNAKMKRVIKKKKYDIAEGEFHVRKLVAMQKTSLIKFVKNTIFPIVKIACNELLFNKPVIIEKCFAHLGIKNTADQQALRDDVCCLVKYALCQKRKYVKERLRIAFCGMLPTVYMVLGCTTTTI